jgi:long-chain-fatty-acid--[acyl-carrier-protein] ligase
MHPGDVAVADRLSGVLTYRKLLVATRLLSKRIRERVPTCGSGDAIGVMLPASAAVDIVFLSLHMAGKLPVMLNWTTGPATLAHAVGKLRVTYVITSKKLIDRLGIEVPGAEYVFLEDLRGGVGKAEALATLLATYFAPHRFLRAVPRVDADDPAVILFTSGSESTPKAVPLSHRNLVTNARDGLLALAATRGDAMLACLPPFHSFGLTGNIIAPLLGGIRLVCHPDPTDAPGLVRTMGGYRPTLLLTTPTFLGYIFSAATPDDLRSLRVIVTGAEKSPEAIFARGAELAPGATILEGYGITECSPMVAANHIGRTKAGTVGLPVASVEVCVVDPESKQPLPAGSTGILLVRGDSVFRGYLAYDGPDPFLTVNGQRWYYTGDLVQLDDEGFVHFQGRLKRFLKAGGEMISLPALEEPLARLYPPTENGPQVAVEGIETPQGRWIVLFTTLDLTLRQANAVLSEAGFRGVMRLDDVVRLDAIPVLGTGKTDYKLLRARAAERAPGTM